jgi:Flp pilus assembly protein TadG
MLGIRNLRRLARDRDGVTIVEFAIVAPVMILFITGLFEFGYVLFARSTLESAVLEAARGSRVANCPNENAKAVEKEIQDRMQIISSSDGVPPILKVESYGEEFGDVGNPEPFTDTNGNGKRDTGESFTDVNGNGNFDQDMGQSGDFGDFGEVVRFTATYNVSSLVPFIATTINDGQDFYPIQSVTVVRNEPFQDTTCKI